MSRPRTRTETDIRYLDKTTGKTVVFSTKSDEVVITFPEGVTESTFSAVLESTSLRSRSRRFHARKGFATLLLDAGQAVSEVVRSLNSSAAVANCIPAMIDEKGSARYLLPDRLTVQFRSDIAPDNAEAIIRACGSRIVVTQRTQGYYTVEVPAGQGLFATIDRFVALDTVEFAAPSEVCFDAQAYVPNDPEFGLQWGLHNTGQPVNGTVGIAGVDIGATRAWDRTRGNPEVIIAVIDTGADLNHEDLRSNILTRGDEDWDFADPFDSVPQDQDPDSHGTHVCGIAAAVDNGVGVVGVAPQCLLMPLRINLSNMTLSDNVDAVNYVTDRAIAEPSRRFVLNCSWKTDADEVGLRTAIRRAVDNNVVVVASAGNDAADLDSMPVFPASYSGVIAVAGLDHRGRKTTGSNFGRSVDISAPGANIRSTVRSNGYAFRRGTSMATSFVSGSAALVWSQNRYLTNFQVRRILEVTCDDVDTANPGHAGKLGHGRVNVDAALRYTPPELAGTYTIQQKVDNLYLDAYQFEDNDHRIVTRAEQRGDPTQRWNLTLVGTVYDLRTAATGYLDAFETDLGRVVTVAAQHNDSQRWIFRPTADDPQSFTIQQFNTGRFLDAYESGSFRAVVNARQNNDSQRWRLQPTPSGNRHTLRQRVNGRYLQAGGADGQVITGTGGNATNQQWILNAIARVYTVRERSNNRFVDAYEDDTRDQRAVTRTAQPGNDSQFWVFTHIGRRTYTLQQMNTARFLEVEPGAADNQVVTRPRRSTNSQRWIVKKV